MRYLFLSITLMLFSIGCGQESKSTEAPSQSTTKEQLKEKIAARQMPRFKSSEEKQEDADRYQSYVAFFEEVFEVMNKNYYRDLNRDHFEQFLTVFDEKIYKQLSIEGKSDDYVRWRSAAHMIDFLKHPEDVFSGFFPPKPAKEYEKTVLGKRIDLGITGKKIKEGFVVEHIEPRSDAYEEGLRQHDLILAINELSTVNVTQEKIDELLNPFEDTMTEISYIDKKEKKFNKIEVQPEEYFKQTVFPMNIPIEGLKGLKIDRFNRKTSEDMLRYLSFYQEQNDLKGLVLDLRDNPGGPPLAAREIASFFLPAGDEFAYFQKKGQPKALLDVPAIPKEYTFDGPMVILVNEESGSASELFSGILQRRKRAVLMGTNTAGQVMLKSMFHFDDDSMVLLITARGHHPDGQVFSFSGLVPNRRISEDEEDDLLQYAANYLLYSLQEQVKQ